MKLSKSKQNLSAGLRNWPKGKQFLVTLTTYQLDTEVS